MSAVLPSTLIPIKHPHWDGENCSDWPWAELPPLTPLIPAGGLGETRFPTTTYICADADRLYVHFDCRDPDIWGTLSDRDADIFEEEVVELFISPGETVPITYYEFEVSPLGTMLDLIAHNPTGDRSSMSVIFAWDCPGLVWSVQRMDHEPRWTASLSLPWRSIGATTAMLPRIWRANFCRIERPRGQEPEFTCWSPTMTDPADFHRPAFFGYLRLPDSLTSAR